MEITQICPLFSIPGEGYENCKEELCAWWDEAGKKCIIRIIGDSLAKIYNSATIATRVIIYGR